MKINIKGEDLKESFLKGWAGSDDIFLNEDEFAKILEIMYNKLEDYTLYYDHIVYFMNKKSKKFIKILADRIGRNPQGEDPTY